MKKLAACAVLAGLVVACYPVLVSPGTAICTAAEPGGRMLAHDVYFTLKDKSEAAKEKLVAGCKEYLSDHPGTVWFAAGVLVREHQRDVNDRGFDVALHLVFQDKASHDKYQDAPRHHQFVEEHGGTWETVRVFDSWLDVSSHGEIAAEPDWAAQAATLRLPEPAARFGGILQGRILARYDGKLVLAVDRVARVWRWCKAKDPQSLVGRKVLVSGPKGDSVNALMIARYIDVLLVGEVVFLDVYDRSQGEFLTISELTSGQRARMDYR